MWALAHMESFPNCFNTGPGRHRRSGSNSASALAASALRRPAARRPCLRELLPAEKSCSSSPAPKEKVCAGQALTFNEPYMAGPELAGQILHVILPEGLHKKSGSSALSRAQAARDASQGRSLKLGCAMCCRGRSLGKRSCSLKLCDCPALPKTY